MKLKIGTKFALKDFHGCMFGQSLERGTLGLMFSAMYSGLTLIHLTCKSRRVYSFEWALIYLHMKGHEVSTFPLMKIGYTYS